MISKHYIQKSTITKRFKRTQGKLVFLVILLKKQYYSGKKFGAKFPAPLKRSAVRAFNSN
jgi:hypothetical protein